MLDSKHSFIAIHETTQLPLQILFYVKSLFVRFKYVSIFTNAQMIDPFCSYPTINTMSWGKDIPRSRVSVATTLRL